MKTLKTKFKDMIICQTENYYDHSGDFSELSIEKKIVPNFFIDKSIKVFDNETLLRGLKLVGDYLEKTVLKPNNLNSPINRNYFINTLK